MEAKEKPGSKRRRQAVNRTRNHNDQQGAGASRRELVKRILEILSILLTLASLFR